MHILLTDLLTCPRCGPGFGLIILADRMEGRQILEGRLGCANCRSTYRVADGIADFRTGEDDHLTLGPREDSAPDLTAGAGDTELPLRTAALIGAQPAGGTVLLIEKDGGHARQIGPLLPETYVVGASDRSAGGEMAEGAVSSILCGDRLPFRGAAFRACAILGRPSEPLLEEATRTLLPGGRLVLDTGTPGVPEYLTAAGFEILFGQDGVVVAEARKPR